MDEHRLCGRLEADSGEVVALLVPCDLANVVRHVQLHTAGLLVAHPLHIAIAALGREFERVEELL